MNDLLHQHPSIHQQLIEVELLLSCAETQKSKVDSHPAAGGDLTAVSEPGDLWPGEAVYSWCMDESTIALRYGLRPLTLHKTTHIWQT